MWCFIRKVCTRAVEYAGALSDLLARSLWMGRSHSAPAQSTSSHCRLTSPTGEWLFTNAQQGLLWLAAKLHQGHTTGSRDIQNGRILSGHPSYTNIRRIQMVWIRLVSVMHVCLEGRNFVGQINRANICRPLIIRRTINRTHYTPLNIMYVYVTYLHYLVSLAGYGQLLCFYQLVECHWMGLQMLQITSSVLNAISM